VYDREETIMTRPLTAAELRDRYLRFFAARGHAVVPGASLVPENPDVLFTTAGMHPLLPYFLGREHPAGPRIVDVQPCLRTVDIDEVGDDTHLTYFEMLGNWSFGDYGRREAITWSHEFLTDVLGLDPARLHVTVFAGNGVSPRDEVSAQLWRDLGIDRISYLGEDDNWWSAGEQGPCGPDTEVFLQVGDELVEIWNNVFIEFDRRDGRYEALSRPCVDTGMGLERTLLAIEGVASVYETSALAPLVEALDTGTDQRSLRILADHVRAVAAVLADPVPTLPANHGRGYVLRRLIRRAVRAGRVLGVPSAEWVRLAGQCAPDRAEHVVTELTAEVVRFERALDRGARELERRLRALARRGSSVLPVADVEALFDTYGLPAEITRELAAEAGVAVESA
jgi:alanyl-tRNA synthetase